MKRFSVIAIVVGIILVIYSAFSPVFTAKMFPVQNSIGIIGGADGPTAKFITVGLMKNIPTVMLMFGVAIAISGLFCLIFRKAVTGNCSLKTSGVSLALSAVDAMGVSCVLSFISCHIMTHPDKHPIRYSTSIIGGAVCLVVFITLFYFYIKCRKTRPSKIGVIIDVSFALLYFIPFIWGFDAIYSILSILI